MSKQATQFDRPALLSELVRRACAVVDPDGADELVGEFELRFEDADEPITALTDLEERLGFGADEDPAVTMAQAVVLYLAHRRDEPNDDPAELLERAAKAEFDGSPPPLIAAWLEDRGVSV
jgi:hypothetical protein